jgi:hypothetical protein
LFPYLKAQKKTPRSNEQGAGGGTDWVTPYDDIKGRKSMQYILSYLSKQEQKTLGVICQLSDIPAPPAAGRRRKVS